MYFSNERMYEFKGKMRDEYNLTQFAMGDFKNYESEEINDKPEYIKLYWKSTKNTFYRIYLMFYIKPYHCIGFVSSILILIYLLCCTGNIIEDKDENIEENKNKEKKD